MIGDSTLVQPASGGPDLAALATFALDPAGRLNSWNQSAERLFGRPAADVLGRHVCDVLLTGPGHPDLVGRALAEVAAGQVWTGQVAGGRGRPGSADPVRGTARAGAWRAGHRAARPRPAGRGGGATLALYTDGLVESRTRPLDDGMIALADALSMTLVPSRPALDIACAAVSSRLLEHGEDDITLVLARLSPS